MKKLFLGLMTSLTLLTGCDMIEDMDNTPTKKVEAYLNKFQMADKDVESYIEDTIDEETDFTPDQIEEYKKILKNNYQKMTYTIKDEKIDGDKATVTAEITVIDYTKAIDDIDNYFDNNSELKDNDNNIMSLSEYKISRLKEVKDTATYTVDFELDKKEDVWVIQNPSNEIMQKINGVYK